MFPRSIGECAAPTPASKFKVPLDVEMLSALLPAWRAASTVVNLSRQNREGPWKSNPPILGGYWGLLYDIFWTIPQDTR